MHHFATDGRSRLGLSAALAALALAAMPAAAHASSYAQLILETPSLEHYWRLGERTGTIAYDSEGRADGRYGAQVERRRPGAIAGDRNAAAGFSGGIVDRVWESHVETDASGLIWGNGSFSWEAWVKPGLLDDRSRRIIAAEDASGGALLAGRASGVVLSRHIKAGTHQYFDVDGSVRVGPVEARATTARADVAAGVWSHVVGTYDGAMLRLYVNGELRDSVASPLMLTTGSGVTIGSEPRGWLEWDGDLDEVALYRGALEPNYVLEHYRAGVGLPCRSHHHSEDRDRHDD